VVGTIQKKIIALSPKKRNNDFAFFAPNSGFTATEQLCRFYTLHLEGMQQLCSLKALHFDAVKQLCFCFTTIHFDF
jgi:hypothetical protein